MIESDYDVQSTTTAISADYITENYRAYVFFSDHDADNLEKLLMLVYNMRERKIQCAEFTSLRQRDICMQI